MTGHFSEPPDSAPEHSRSHLSSSAPGQRSELGNSRFDTLPSSIAYRRCGRSLKPSSLSGGQESPGLFSQAYDECCLFQREGGRAVLKAAVSSTSQLRLWQVDMDRSSRFAAQVDLAAAVPLEAAHAALRAFSERHLDTGSLAGRSEPARRRSSLSGASCERAPGSRAAAGIWISAVLCPF